MPGSGPVAGAKGDDALGLAAGLVEVAELTHAPRGFTGKRAFIKKWLAHAGEYMSTELVIATELHECERTTEVLLGDRVAA